jgi:hypothetical protein
MSWFTLSPERYAQGQGLLHGDNDLSSEWRQYFTFSSIYWRLLGNWAIASFETGEI